MKIFLIGLMGSGKSYWTQQLAKKYKTGGYDLDYLIEVREEKTIAEIFAEDGEDYFRKAESTVLKWFDQKKTYVLATGGGAPCFFDNMAWMNKQGITIWLDEPLPVIAARLAPEKAHRLRGAVDLLGHGDHEPAAREDQRAKAVIGGSCHDHCLLVR